MRVRSQRNVFLDVSLNTLHIAYRMNWFLVALTVFSSWSLSSAQTIPPRQAYPQIISHRGASGYVPEHSLQAYQLAIDLKTDYIEPDLCLSKDG